MYHFIMCDRIADTFTNLKTQLFHIASHTYIPCLAFQLIFLNPRTYLMDLLGLCPSL